MKAIVLLDENFGVAKDGKQPVYIKEDLKRFRQLTIGKTIIFGRKTLETFPNSKPLPGRANICLSGSLRATDDEGLIVVRDIETLLKNTSPDSFCVGGASVYKQLYPYFTDIYVTRILKNLCCDQFFPPFDLDPKFDIPSRSSLKHDKTTGLTYRYETYRRRS